MITTKEHKQRVKAELRAAGVTNYGLLKPESRNLPQVIQEDEHIRAVVYGRATTSGGAMLVATNLRVIYFNRMPLFATLDEVTYDLVSGVSKGSEGGLFAAVTLHTRAGDYTIRFANVVCADRFVKYIERQCIENTSEARVKSENTDESEVTEVFLNANEAAFLRTHEVATLSTIDRSGNVDGAAVYYCTFDSGADIYIVTKGGTQKMHNIFTHPQVALTIYEEQTLQTLQIQAIAVVETNNETKQKVFKQIVHERTYGVDKKFPPVTQLQNESFMVVRIHPTVARFRDYKNFTYERDQITGKEVARNQNNI